MTWEFSYDTKEHSFPNFVEQMDLTCESHHKIVMAPIAQIVTGLVAVMAAPFVTKIIGMRALFIVMTAF